MRFAPDGAGGVICHLDREEAEVAARDGYVSIAPGEAGALDIARSKRMESSFSRWWAAVVAMHEMWTVPSRWEPVLDPRAQPEHASSPVDLPPEKATETAGDLYRCARVKLDPKANP